MATFEKLNTRVNFHQAKRIYTDNYKAYAEVIGSKSLKQGKQILIKVSKITVAKDTDWQDSIEEALL